MFVFKERERIMSKESIVCLTQYRESKSLEVKMSSYRNYLELLDDSELVAEANAFMSQLRTHGVQKDCAEKGKAIFTELIDRLKSSKSCTQQILDLRDSFLKSIQ